MKFSCRCWRAAKPWLIVGVGLIPAVITADENHGEVSENGRFTPNVEGAQFPPQPRQIDNVRQFRPASNNVASRSLQFEVNSVLTDNAVVNALGSRYAKINSVTIESKTNTTANRVLEVYFSHSNNQTVNVTTQNGSVVDVAIEAPSSNQPPLSESEMNEAIRLAEDYWLERGKASVNQLQGYAIQTFQSNGNPYNTRMVYVSFHTESPEPPLLYNLVDLSVSAVVSGEEE